MCHQIKVQPLYLILGPLKCYLFTTSVQQKMGFVSVLWLKTKWGHYKNRDFVNDVALKSIVIVKKIAKTQTFINT